MTQALRIVIPDVGREPGHGGARWAVLQYVIGLRRLGHEVVLASSGRTSRIEADLALNISGRITSEALAHVPIRAYLDLDPGFNQLWQEQGITSGFEDHTNFVTVGLAVGQPGCDVPTTGRRWFSTLPPVVLDRWPVVHAIETDAFTTVANFRSYGSIDRFGVHYGQKVHSLRKLMDLPTRVKRRFVLAMRVHDNEKADLDALRENRWELVDPCMVAATPERYRRFVSRSRAEIGIAKSGYVASRCGWFSDRSVCYLASGRPVVAQETGFSRFLPTGEGLLVFADTSGAVDAIERVDSDYARHARAARRIAEEHFDSDRVLTRLIEAVST